MNNIQLGANVDGSDQSGLGKVKLLVADPNTNKVTHLVIEKGFLDTRQVVVDASFVSDVQPDGKKVMLNLTKEQLEAMPDFIERNYLPNENDNYLASTEGYVYPAVSTPAAPASYIGSIANPLLGNDAAATLPYTETMNVPDNSMLIKEGATVEALDGRIGRVKKVNFEPNSNRVASFVVEKGLFFSEDYEIPVDLVKSSSEKTVFLTVDKSSAQAMINHDAQ